MPNINLDCTAQNKQFLDNMEADTKRLLKELKLPRNFKPLDLPQETLDQLDNFEPAADSLKLKKHLLAIQQQCISVKNTTKAMNKLVELCDSHKPEVSRRACMTILKLAHMDQTPDLYPIEPKYLFPDDEEVKPKKKKKVQSELPTFGVVVRRTAKCCQKEPIMARRKFTREFKLSAVQLVNQQGYSVPEAAKSLGVDPHCIRYWCEKLGKESGNAPAGEGAPWPRNSGGCVRKNARLVMERDILKKRRRSSPGRSCEVRLHPLRPVRLRCDALLPGS